MLRDPKAQALVENFAGQWLQLRNLKTVAPDPRPFPTFDEPLREAMLKETELFFEAVMREDRSILDFLDADFTFLNERLAKHYGIPGVKGDEFRRVTLKGDAARRPAHAGERPDGHLEPDADLAGEARQVGARADPRARRPRPRRRTCPSSKRATRARSPGTLRQRMEQHRANPSCASCHAGWTRSASASRTSTPSAPGATRTASSPIDASGTLPDGRVVQRARRAEGDPQERKTEFARCLAEKMLTYALGRGLEDYDNCAVDEIVDGRGRRPVQVLQRWCSRSSRATRSRSDEGRRNR